MKHKNKIIDTNSIENFKLPFTGEGIELKCAVTWEWVTLDAS